MTRTISLIIGIAAVVLTVAVPTALAEGRLGGSQEQQAVAPDWFERAAIAAQRNSQVYVDAADRVVEPQSIVALRLRSEGLNRIHGLGEFATPYRDSADRVVEPQSLKALTARSVGLNRMYELGEFAGSNGYVDASERAVPPVETPVSVRATGNDFEWPQVGIGLGVGILLLFGLGLTMRAAHVRPFAH
ncbi:MAG TPA: hypothetical protein VFU99_04550 [Gaiellaceae bacterium]|nr:hypothetical protein [Gaiellaceae bacterium]